MTIEQIAKEAHAVVYDSLSEYFGRLEERGIELDNIVLYIDRVAEEVFRHIDTYLEIKEEKEIFLERNEIN